MEFAIPLVALGGLYISSNTNNQGKDNGKVKRETFENMGKSSNYLPNTDVPANNYPKTANNDLGEDQIRAFPSNKSSVDQYYNTKIYEEQANKGVRVGNKIQEVVSMNGNVINTDEFKHNNMVPFFRGSLRGGTTDLYSNESRLDNMQGIGSQYIKKQEVAPLFKPQESMQFPHGMPNNSDFYQSRVNPSNRMANIKPWAEQKVAPGLNMGYGTEGSGAFNSGMEARESWLPRTVDELRVSTNPKVTYSLMNHEGPAAYEVKNMGIMGKMEKNRPDTDFEWGQDRLFTTTGAEHAPTQRGIEIMQPQNRTSTTKSYYGVAGSGKDNKGTYTQTEYEPAKKQTLGAVNIGGASAGGQGGATSGDYGVQGYKMLPNNRTTANTQIMGGVGGLLKAAITPVLDVLRPTRKENVVGSARPSGNVGVTAPAHRAYNPADRTKTTIREMTGDKLDNNHLNVQNQREGAYNVSKHTPIHNQRDTTSISYTGTAGGAASQTGVRSYHSVQNQHNNVNKTYLNRPNQGGTQMFNQNENISIARRDGDRNNNRWGVASGGPSIIPTMETHGRIHGGQTAFSDIEKQQLDRINPELLDAFRSNPYTKSLNSWA